MTDTTNSEATNRGDSIENRSVRILVLHWKGLEKTRSCLESLRTLEFDSYKVLVVDNGSEDYDGEKLKESFPEIEVLRLDSNRGFSGGCNAGMEFCMEKGCNYIWLLNNDTLVFPDTLSQLVDCGERHPKAGAIGASLVRRDEHGGTVVAHAGIGKIDFLSAKTYLLPTQGTEECDCDWLSGSNLLLRTSALKQTGLLNDDYFLYFEDVELCFRLRQNGWQCYLVPSARIEHEEGGSTSGDLRTWRYYYHARNRCIFFSENSPGHLKPLSMMRIGAHFFRRFLTLPFKGGEGKRKLHAEFQAVSDFLSGKRGKGDI
ncbi:MAG: glycosyltransferase family 2 protein [Cyanobacteria bacterium]|nr:glycosyltransferase family 2 protein [Cyanobacteriota bacterium]